MIKTSNFEETIQLFLASEMEKWYYMLDIMHISPQRDIPLFVSASRETNNDPLKLQWCKQQWADYINGVIQSDEEEKYENNKTRPVFQRCGTDSVL